MRKMLPLSALFLALASAAPALAEQETASCGNAPRAQWLSEDAIKAKGVELGYDVRSVKSEDGCYELKAIDKANVKVELYLHPVTGEVVKLKDQN
jgi:hypothetical protein